jgi:hypothetical protein
MQRQANLLCQVQKVPVLGIGWRIERPSCFEAKLFWQWEYGVAPVPQVNCVVMMQDITLCNEQ